jgi:membrane fusion protein (multidrug efflux system)
VLDRVRGLSIASGLLALALNIAVAAQPVPANDNALTDKDGRVRVQLTARNEVVLSSEISAKISNLPLREGDAFHAGQMLASFDCSLYQAQLNKAQASLEASRQALTVSKRLADLNSIGALEVAQTEGKAKENAAEVAYMQATVAKCNIAAPFSGRVAKRLVAAHQYVTPGTPLLGILDTGVMELQMIVPSRWLAWLKPGQHFSVQVDELGKTVAGQVARIGARIDPVSQSIAITGVIDGNTAQLLPGMSGWATFPNAK